MLLSLNIGIFAQAKKESISIDKLNVVSSFYPIYFFTNEIGKDKINNTILIPSNVEPHDFEITTKDMIKLEKADIVFYNSRYFEGYMKQIETNLSYKVDFIECSKDVKLLKGHHHHHHHTSDKHNHKNQSSTKHHDESEHHSESKDIAYDPHTWLSPINAKLICKVIYENLSKKDAQNKDFYKNNYDKLIKKLDKLNYDYKNNLVNLSNDTIIVSHMAFGYLCDLYNFKQVAIRGFDAESEPSAKDLANIIDFAKEKNIKVIFSEDFVNPKLSNILANELNIKVEVLSPIEGLSSNQNENNDDYFTIMYYNLEKIKEALK